MTEGKKGKPSTGRYYLCSFLFYFSFAFMPFVGKIEFFENSQLRTARGMLRRTKKKRGCENGRIGTIWSRPHAIWVRKNAREGLQRIKTSRSPAGGIAGVLFYSTMVHATSHPPPPTLFATVIYAARCIDCNFFFISFSLTARPIHLPRISRWPVTRKSWKCQSEKCLRFFLIARENKMLWLKVKEWWEHNWF